MSGRGVAGFLAAALTAGALAGCASRPASMTRSVAATAPRPASTTAERLATAVSLLKAGRPVAARAAVVAVLTAEPGEPSARLYLDQIDMDPRVLLGDRSFRHRAGAGESFETLAQRYLGDSRLFYALARFNGVVVPDGPIEGRMLLIPGGARPVAIERRRGRLVRPVPASSPPGDPAGARALRSRALVALDGGQVDGAVALLERASRLDPANGAIQAELAKAQRIQAAVHGRP